MAVRDPQTEWLRVEIYRRMTGAQKIEIAAQMYEDAVAAVRASIRYRRPDIADDDLEFEVRCRVLGRELAELSEEARRSYVKRRT
jgi:acyl-CoA thioesterase FadM